MDRGYCRVNSIDQNETRQTLKMKSLGIEDGYIFTGDYLPRLILKTKYTVQK